MPRPRPIRSAAIVAVLLLGGCSATGQLAVESETSTTGSVPDSTTTEATTSTETTTPTEGTTTSTTEERRDAPTLAQLEALLPTAEDLGTVWTEVDAIENDDSTVFEDQCPKLDRYRGSDQEKAVKRSYMDEDGFRFDLAFTLDTGVFTDDELVDRMLDDYADCELDFEEGGIHYSVQFTGERIPEMGRNGVALTGDSRLTFDDTDFDANIYNFATMTSNGVRLIAATEDLLDPDGRVQPVNADLFPGLLTALVAEIEAL